MNIVDYLNKEEIINLYERIHTYEDMGSMWQYRAVPLLNLCLELEEIGEGNTRQERLLSLLSYETLIQLYQYKSLRNDLQITLDRYIENLPNFNKDSIKQSDTTLETHGYCAMIIFRYIRNICNENIVSTIFKKSWGETLEKIEIVNDFFKDYLDNPKTFIAYTLNKYELNEITNFSILKLFLDSPINDDFLKLIYKIWSFQFGRIAEEHEKFTALINFIEKIEFKDSLYIDLCINESESKGTSKV
jgi:hypothetical protein